MRQKGAAQRPKDMNPTPLPTPSLMREKRDNRDRKEQAAETGRVALALLVVSARQMKTRWEPEYQLSG